MALRNVLEVESVQLSFGHRSILSDVYLQCCTGKITGLLGRNGQGKSSLFRIMAGSLPAEGMVRVNNKSVQSVYRQPAVLRYLPEFSFVPKGLTIRRVFDDFGIDFAHFQKVFPEFAGRYHTPVEDLSGGGKRLVELFAILRSNSPFVLLDEPFTHLSPLQVEKVILLLTEEKEKKGILLTDHMFRHVLDISDHCYVLTEGKTHLIRSEEDIVTFGYAGMM